MAHFFSKLRYSFGNEDWRTEKEALNIQPKDHVLCITASGDRPLNLLQDECSRMVCVDANPAQNHLLNLKVAAMQLLDYPNYLAFLGCDPSKNRKKTFQQISSFMRSESIDFWNARKSMIEKGVVYQGAVERLLKVVSALLRMISGKKINRLFEFNDLEEQKKFLKEEWNNPLVRKLLNLALNSFLSSVIIQDPGLKNFSKDIRPGDYIYDRMNASLHKGLAKENLLLSLILKGKVMPAAYSPYLTEEGIKAIKPRLSRLEVRTSCILECLESFDWPSFDVFSLSDVPSYLSYANFKRLLEGILKAAKPGARFSLRQFMSTYEIPPHLQKHFIRNHELEKKLEDLDSCFVYRYMTGTISK